MGLRDKINYYTGNSDILFHIKNMIDWKTIVPLVDVNKNFSSVEEAVSMYEEVLSLCGEICGVGGGDKKSLAELAIEVDKKGCKFENGKVILPEELTNGLGYLAEAGLISPSIPEDGGGMGFPKTVSMILTEMVSRADASLMNFYGLPEGIAETIYKFGSKEQKEKYLSKIISGELKVAMALTEENAGSDLRALKMLATKKEDGSWTLKGKKVFITIGCGDLILTMAKTDPNSRDLSMFLNLKDPRLEVIGLESKLGIKGSPTCELDYNNCPAELIGEVGKGFDYVIYLMDGSRLGIASQALGIADAALYDAKNYAAWRKQFGFSLNMMPPIKEMLTEMQMDVEASRSVLYAASQVVDIKEAFERIGKDKEAKKLEPYSVLLTCLSKYAVAEIANNVADKAVQIFGGNGYIKDFPVERYFRDARITNIYEGTSQIQTLAALQAMGKGAAHMLLDDVDKTLKRISKPSLEKALSCVRDAKGLFEKAAFYISKDKEYAMLSAKNISDMMFDLYASAQLLKQAQISPRKEKLANMYVSKMLPRMRAKNEIVTSGDRKVLDDAQEILYGGDS